MWVWSEKTRRIGGEKYEDAQMWNQFSILTKSPWWTLCMFVRMYSTTAAADRENGELLSYLPSKDTKLSARRRSASRRSA